MEITSHSLTHSRSRSRTAPIVPSAQASSPTQTVPSSCIQMHPRPPQLLPSPLSSSFLQSAFLLDFFSSSPHNTTDSPPLARTRKAQLSFFLLHEFSYFFLRQKQHLLSRSRTSPTRRVSSRLSGKADHATEGKHLRTRLTPLTHTPRSLQRCRKRINNATHLIFFSFFVS